MTRSMSTARLASLQIRSLVYPPCFTFHMTAEARPTHFPMGITAASFPSDVPIVVSLFTSYASWLNLDLSFQDYSQELADLPGKYKEPKGCILLARRIDTDQVVGCIALRPLASTPGQAEGLCEIKRLYVLPEGRGKGVGRALVGEVIEKARKAGYRYMLLDTLPRMSEAMRMYERFGFERVDKYYDTPIDDTVFYRLAL